MQQQPCRSSAAATTAASAGAGATARFSLSVLSVCRERLNATGLWKSCVQENLSKATKREKEKRKKIPNCKQDAEKEMCKK